MYIVLPASQRLESLEMLEEVEVFSSMHSAENEAKTHTFKTIIYQIKPAVEITPSWTAKGLF